ncbi:MAG: hypothetical protein HYW06_05110 [Gemmatimonadetes bacterium]|nr:hypothetical protein [Gemmatimonadota bacterium]
MRPRKVDRSSPTNLIRQVDAQLETGVTSPDTVPTGFPSVDRLLGGGLRRRDLVVLGGDVGSGKSALALGFGLRAAQAGHRVAFFSGEMDEDPRSPTRRGRRWAPRRSGFGICPSTSSRCPANPSTRRWPRPGVTSHRWWWWTICSSCARPATEEPRTKNAPERSERSRPWRSTAGWPASPWRSSPTTWPSGMTRVPRWTTSGPWVP